MVKDNSDFYEIVVTNKNEALKVRLPENVVQRIKEVSELKGKDFEDKPNDVILEIVIQSLDRLLYGHQYAKCEPHTNKDGASLDKKKK